MKPKQKSLYAILSLIVVGTLFLSGCEETPSDQKNNENRVYIENGNDDGHIAILTDAFPDFFGYVTAESDQQLIAGLSTSDFSPDGDNLTSRGIFRFNISEWNGTDIIIYLKCIHIEGHPGKLEVHLTDDPNPLPDYPEMRDISDIWLLVESSGIVITEVIPSENKWMNITISGDMRDIVNRMYPEKDYMAIMLKLFDENIDSNSEYYGFATVDYTPSVDSDQPYLVYIH